MFGKKKGKTQEQAKTVCEICGLDCRDSSSLDRHMEWAHRDQKTAPKP
jgi:transcription initiation factor TFIIIB Brf1 subunit/transcription initiation factor TFIIB